MTVKRILILMFAVFVLCGMCGCTKNDISADEPATLTYIYKGKNISETLTADETAVFAEIFNGRREYRLSAPSCSFAESISVEIDGVVFAPARDKCPAFKNVSKGSYFDVSEEEIERVREIFKKYGGEFPCV